MVIDFSSRSMTVRLSDDDKPTAAGTKNRDVQSSTENTVLEKSTRRTPRGILCKTIKKIATVSLTVIKISIIK